MISMIKVTAARLKARLGEYLKAVRRGQEFVVTNREDPVARLLPYRSPGRKERPLASRPRDPGAPPLGRVSVRSIRFLGTDTTALLRQDRDRR